MTSLTAFDQNYFRLVLEIDKHIDGYIDAYYGPAFIKEEVGRAPKKDVLTLRQDLLQLQEQIPAEPLSRNRYVTAVLRAIDCTLRMLDGETFDYLEEVYRIYDIRPQLVDEARFLEAHAALDELLPGDAPIMRRLQQWRTPFMLPQDKIMALLDFAKAETRERTAVFLQPFAYQLPSGEDIELKLTENQPWGAYNWYLGDYKSLVEFNVDNPLSALGILSTFAHEGYPGHHTEGILKEKYLYRMHGYAEEAVKLLHSPSAVIAEGIATTALEIIFPKNEAYQWVVDYLLPAADIHVDVSAEALQRITEASLTLRYVGENAATKYHSGELDQEETITYMQKYGLRGRARAEKGFEFITHPLFRSYSFTYTQGYDLITRGAVDGDKSKIFCRLLTEQVLPSQLT